MSYVDKHLVPGEAVEYRAHLHWIIFLAPLFVGLAGAVLLALGAVADRGPWAALLGLALLAIALIVALVRWVVRITSEFAVTNRRVLIKVGVLSRHSLELLLTKVEGIGVDQDLWGRLLDYGTVVVSGTGGTREAFAKIADPLRFRTEVQSRVPI